MYLIACGLMLLISLVVNASDRRMLVLTLAVGINIFCPTPDNFYWFYVTVIGLEIFVIISALVLDANASILVAELCALLVITHLMGYALDGSPPFSPYRVIVKLLEFSQLAACAALSPVIAPILRNHDAKTQ